MYRFYLSKPAALGFGFAGVLFLGIAGCGGGGGKVEDAVLVPGPEADLSGGAGGGGSAASAGKSTATSSSAGTAKETSTTESASVKSEGWGTLKGKVVLEGAVPASKMLVPKGAAKKDFPDGDYCGKEGVPSQRLIVDSASKGVKNVLVYIPKPSAVNPDAKKAVPAEVEFDQKNCAFSPHVMGIQAGSTVVMKSADVPSHNVHGVLGANGQFNQAISSGQSLPFPAKSPERRPYKIICDIHPWMSAWWMILDNPYWAVTDANGNFEIKNAPAGTQKVVVWQEALDKSGFLTPASGETVTIKAGGETTKDFSVPASRLNPAG